jgi:hypothetical protein
MGAYATRETQQVKTSPRFAKNINRRIYGIPSIGYQTNRLHAHLHMIRYIKEPPMNIRQINSIVVT